MGFKSLSREELTGSLRVIGDRASGKTTYMAALARWPNPNPSSPVQGITASNREGEDLKEKAQKILEQGLQLEQTRLVNNVTELKDYSLRILLKNPVSWNKSTNIVPLDINCKDYPGEFFSDLLHQSGSPILQDYLEDCLQSTAILLLIDGNAYRKDAEYAIGLDKLIVALDRTDLKGAKRRIALVLNKCELPDLWVNRHKPRFLAEARFREVCRKLETWQKSGWGRVDYFTASAFGILGKQCPTSNSKQIYRGLGGVASVLEDPKRWRPFGLVSPIYWLCTGKRHKELDED